LLRLAGRLDVNQVTLTAGEGIADLPEIMRVCRYYGYTTWFEYLTDLLRTIESTNGRPLVPVLDVGAISFAELQKMRLVVPALRIMLESADDSLLYRAAHRGAPQKSFAARLRALETAGCLGVPVVTGILVGIGEHSSTWARAAEAIASLHERYHHIQQFVLTPFQPSPRTPMELHAPPSVETFTQACSVVRKVLDSRVIVSAEIGGRLDFLGPVLETGIRDLGEIRLATSERVDTELACALAEVGRALAKDGLQLRPRQTLVNGIRSRGILPAEIMGLLRRQREYQRPRRDGNDSSATTAL
jgi:7,8-didemethyl-8-hydroxy-5-deazariboflavin synthase CofG subunit